MKVCAKLLRKLFGLPRERQSSDPGPVDAIVRLLQTAIGQSRLETAGSAGLAKMRTSML